MDVERFPDQVRSSQNPLDPTLLELWIEGRENAPVVEEESQTSEVSAAGDQLEVPRRLCPVQVPHRTFQVARMVLDQRGHLSLGVLLVPPDEERESGTMAAITQ